MWNIFSILDVLVFNTAYCNETIFLSTGIIIEKILKLELVNFLLEVNL